MVDLPQTDNFDDWFFNTNESINSDVVNQTSPSSLPSSPNVSSNESSLPITNVSSLSTDSEENQTKKRKNEQITDSNESKKSKQVPPYMRRNIRHLLTNDKLQDDTLSALKAEQERLKRLEETNHTYPHLPIYSNQKSTEQECIVLDDDDDEDEKPSQSEFDLPPEEKHSIKEPIQTTNDDSNDSTRGMVIDESEEQTSIIEEKELPKTIPTTTNLVTITSLVEKEIEKTLHETEKRLSNNNTNNISNILITFILKCT